MSIMDLNIMTLSECPHCVCDYTWIRYQFSVPEDACIWGYGSEGWSFSVFRWYRQVTDVVWYIGQYRRWVDVPIDDAHPKSSYQRVWSCACGYLFLSRDSQQGMRLESEATFTFKVSMIARTTQLLLLAFSMNLISSKDLGCSWSPLESGYLLSSVQSSLHPLIIKQSLVAHDHNSISCIVCIFRRNLLDPNSWETDITNQSGVPKVGSEAGSWFSWQPRFILHNIPSDQHHIFWCPLDPRCHSWESKHKQIFSSIYKISYHFL